MTEEMKSAPVEASAEDFLLAELTSAKKTLQRVRIVGSLLVIAVAVYLGVVTNFFVQSLKPATAAEIAAGMITDQIDNHAPAFVEGISNQATAIAEQLPEMAKEQFTAAREGITGTFEAHLRGFCKEKADGLSNDIDKYIAEHKEEVKALIETGKDPAALKAASADMNKLVMDYIKEKSASGESIISQIEDSTKMLNDAKARIHRLATAKDLTPAEKKARRAIAVIANTVDKSQLQPISLPKLSAPEDAPDEAPSAAPKAK